METERDIKDIKDTCPEVTLAGDPITAGARRLQKYSKPPVWISLIMLIIFSAYAYYNLDRIIKHSWVGECCSNCRQIQAAINDYAKANGGKYPETLEKLVPQYIKEIPPCPSAGVDTYCSSYTVNVEPAAYTFYCKGFNHTNADIPPDYPICTSDKGLKCRIEGCEGKY